MSAHDPNANRPGYKETKVGWIPEEWECVPLGNVFSESREKGKEGLATYSVTVDRGLIPRSELDRKMAPDLPPDQSLLLKKGFVAYNMMRMWQGSAAVAKSPGVVSPAYVVAKPKAEVSSEFLLRYFKSHRGLYELWAYSYGITNDRLRLYFNDFAKVPAPLPPNLEQLKIAEILSSCDERIEAMEQLIKAKRRQKSGLMQRLLTGTERLPGYSGDWVGCKLGAILSHVFRPVEWAPDKLFHLVSVKRNSLGLFRREPLRGDQYKTTDLHVLKEGDFVISKRQVTHGALAMVTHNFDGCHVSKEYSIFLNAEPTRLHMPFLDWFSRLRRFWWLAYVASNGVVIEKLIFDPKTFLRFEILLPPTLEEQVAISDLLDTCDFEIRLLKRKLFLLKRQTKSLTQKLLTGQVRVNV